MYLAMFAISGFCFYLSQNTRSILKLAVLAVAMSLPCLMAGFRDLSVGTDLQLWGIYTYDVAKTMPFIPFLEYHSDEAGLAFNVLAWVGAQIGDDMVPFLSLIQLVTILPFYMGLKALYPKQIWMGMLFYLLFLYPPSLNTMKQMIAASIVFYGMQYLFGKSFFKFACCVVIAALFHQTAIIAIVFYPAAVLLRAEDDATDSSQKCALLVLLTVISYCAVFFAGEHLVIYFSGFKESYAAEVSTLGQGGFNWSILVIAAGVLLVWMFDSNRRDSQATISSTAGVLPIAIYCVIWGCIAFELGMISPALSRFSYFGTSMMAFVICEASNAETGKRALSVLLLFITLAYFIFNFVIRGGESIYPYASAILGI